MSGFALGVWLGVLLSLVAAYGLLAYTLAQSKIFFTSPVEGTGEFVVRGNTVSKLIVVWNNHYAGGLVGDDNSKVFDPYEIFVGDPPVQSFWYYLNPLHWMEPLGIYWVGLWPWLKVYGYDFTWTEGKQDEEGKVKPVTRRATKNNPSKEQNDRGQTHFVYLNAFNYYFVITNVKTKSGVPLKFVLVVTIQVTNPYKALFSGEDWLQQTGAAISQMVIRYAGALEYEDITASKPAQIVFRKAGATTSETRECTLEELIKSIADNADNTEGHDLQKALGVSIKSAKIDHFDYADETTKTAYQEASTALYVAEQKGRAVVMEATKDKEAIGIRADAEKGRIDTVYSSIVGDDKDARLKIRQLEALEKAGSAGGSTIVLPDSVVGLAERIAGKGV